MESEKMVSDLMEGLEPVDPKDLEAYRKEMEEVVIPKLIEMQKHQRWTHINHRRRTMEGLRCS